MSLCLTFPLLNGIMVSMLGAHRFAMKMKWLDVHGMHRTACISMPSHQSMIAKSSTFSSALAFYLKDVNLPSTHIL